MKNTNSQKNTRPILIVTAVLFVLLCVLTYATINVILNSSSVQSSVPFDLDRITADKTAEYTDVADMLIPSFVGITADNNRYGASVSVNTVAELYRMITPALASVMADEYVKIGDNELWDSLIDKKDSVYVRYHSELPDYVISIFADTSNDARNSFNTYVYELFLLPYSETSDTITVVTRNVSGKVTVYEQPSPEEIITTDDLRKILRSYRANLTEFKFEGENQAVASVTEPVFMDSVTTRNIITTGKSGSLILNKTDDVGTILRLFAMNPDKLLNQHTENDGSTSYIDTKGILYLRDASFEYTAAADGGINVEAFVGYTDNVGLMDYVQAAVKIFETIRAINRNCAGGDADIALNSVETQGGRVTLTFMYIFDNLEITDIEPAFAVTFENEMLRSAKLFNLAVRNLGDRNESLSEWWFIDFAQEKMSKGDSPFVNIGLVYRADYVANSVKAQWRAR